MLLRSESEQMKIMNHENILNSHPKEFVPEPCTCRVCGNTHGVIRKYGLNCCRRCFRDHAEEMGFVKNN